METIMPLNDILQTKSVKKFMIKHFSLEFIFLFLLFLPFLLLPSLLPDCLVFFFPSFPCLPPPGWIFIKTCPRSNGPTKLSKTPSVSPFGNYDGRSFIHSLSPSPIWKITSKPLDSLPLVSRTTFDRGWNVQNDHFWTHYFSLHSDESISKLLLIENKAVFICEINKHLFLSLSHLATLMNQRDVQAV